MTCLRFARGRPLQNYTAVSFWRFVTLLSFNFAYYVDACFKVIAEKFGRFYLSRNDKIFGESKATTCSVTVLVVYSILPCQNSKANQSAWINLFKVSPP